MQALSPDSKQYNRGEIIMLGLPMNTLQDKVCHSALSRTFVIKLKHKLNIVMTARYAGRGNFTSAYAT